MKITLNDCLACSGCMTSAETVLITQQNQQELYRVLDENARRKQVCVSVCLCMRACVHECVYLFLITLLRMLISSQVTGDAGCSTVVVSISPQSMASIAAKYKISNEEMMGKMTTFFKSIGEFVST